MVKRKVEPEAPKLIGEVMTITPEIAVQWLERNRRNRPIHQKALAELTRQMAAGRWVLNGETIKWSGDPRVDNGRAEIVDGQHRLWAVFDSGVTIESMVVFNAPPGSFETIDIGSKRTAADSLGLVGERDPGVLAATVKAVWRRDNGTLSSAGNPSPTPQETREVLARYPDIRDAVEYVMHNKHKLSRYLTNSMAAYVYYEAAQRDPARAVLFMEQLRDGVGLDATSPVLLLRDRLAANRTNPKAKLLNREVLALCTKAWNAFYAGKPVRSLRMLNEEAFPVFLPPLRTIALSGGA